MGNGSQNSIISHSGLSFVGASPFLLPLDTQNVSVLWSITLSGG